jgi:hypothetical protein
LGNLSTPNSVQKLQKALHAKAKAEAGYRFYALYDKISREDILAHAYAQCRSNKGAPGVDGQEFADIEAYGVQRWLGELALAIRQETYRPAPIRRVFIPKANGKLRPLGISTLRDRVCMTAAMLVLEPIFEADLSPEQAYRPPSRYESIYIKYRSTCCWSTDELAERGVQFYTDESHLIAQASQSRPLSKGHRRLRQCHHNHRERRRCLRTQWQTLKSRPRCATMLRMECKWPMFDAPTYRGGLPHASSLCS